MKLISNKMMLLFLGVNMLNCANSAGYVKTTPDIAYVKYSSPTPIALYLDSKIGDPMHHRNEPDNAIVYKEWRKTVSDAMLEVFKPHFPNIILVEKQPENGVVFIVSSCVPGGNFQPKIDLTCRMLFLKDGTEFARIEGVSDSAYYIELERSVKIAMEGIQKDFYNKLFVSAEGKGFRNKLK